MAAIPVLVIVTLLAIGWRKWPDILVDFGSELYLPWQVSSGKVLYRDIEHIFGPLSVYFNAALFSVFGTSFTVLFTANIVLYCAFMAFLYAFVRRISSAIAASVACTLVAVFTLSQYTICGNYNFISPFSHEAIHGLMLSMFSLQQLWSFSVTARRSSLVTAGILLGCVMLTRVEIGLVACIVSMLFFLLLVRNGRAARLVASMVLFAGSAVLPSLIVAAYFGMVSSGREVTFFITKPWQYMLSPAITDTSFYRSGMGLDNLSGNLLRMATGAAIFLLPTVAVLLARFRNRYVMVTTRLALALYLSAAGHYWGDTFFFPALPLIVFVSALFMVWEYRHEGDKHAPTLALILISALSLGLLCKTLLNCRIYQYGFYVALPAVVLIAIMLTWYLPAWLEHRGRNGAGFRNSMLLFLACFAAHYMWTGAGMLQLKTHPVELCPDDKIMAFTKEIDARTPLVSQAVQWIDSNVCQDETCLVLPEGVMLNFLTRRENPTPYCNLMVPELVYYGEGTILNEFKSHSPDVILVALCKDPSEYGVGPFGVDPANGRMIMEWIESAYRPVALFGSDPLAGYAMGIKVYRKEVSADSAATGT